MASIALSFNNVDLTTIDRNDGQIWVTSSELAKALNYKRSDTVSRIYSRNADEFTSSMSLTVKMGVKGFGSGNSEKEVRLFSLRGCHLIAMFASTDVSKKFRKWVLDLIDNHTQKEKLPLSVQQSLDAVYAIRAIESDKASGHGYGLNKWKGDKVVYDEAITTIMEYIQPELPNLSNKEG
ncbi:BRO family protein [Psychrobacter glacincola]|uniref:BRO family protein n=1 Tax=Psychrobacter glacincola TaxID=56810 RepID=UPI0039B039D8